MIRSTFPLAAVLLLLAGCTPPAVQDPPAPPVHGDSGDSGSGQPGDTDDSGKPHDSDSPLDSDTADPWVDFDCDAIEEGPFEATAITAWTVEDLDFDDDGYMIGSDWQHVYRTDYNGEREVLVPNLNFRAGMRRLPNGDIVLANDTQGSLMRLYKDQDYAYETIVPNLRYPDGIEVDRNGIVYVTEHDDRQVHRVDPDTGEVQTIVDQDIRSPNGITFNETWDALYMAGFSGEGILYRLPIDEDGNTGELEVYREDVGSGWLDGMGVDYCGNIYIADYMRSKLVRLFPDGEFRDIVADGADMGGYIYMPNFQWGSGIGGWDPLKLYIADGSNAERSWELDLGVPSKRR